MTCPYSGLPQSSGLQQKTFMGASIRGFNSNVGWGSTSSSLNVDLVVDVKNGDYFSPVPVGQPAFFEYYDYYFGGIVQKYEQQDNFSGSPLFSAVIQDTKEILQGVQIVTNKYYGSTYNVPNVYNVYGYYEYNAFGSSLANNAGMPWKLVRDGLQELVKITPINYRGVKYYLDFSNLNRLPDYYRIGGESNISVYEFISKICQDSAVDFYLKLFKIPVPATLGKRFRGAPESKTKFMERCISSSGVLCWRFSDETERKSVCEGAWNQVLEYIQPSGIDNEGNLRDILGNIITKDCQLPYSFPTSLPPCESRYRVKDDRFGDNVDTSYYNLIKIYVMDRSTEPQLGKISQFISNTTGAASKSIGIEFRNQNNNKFLVGGQKLSFYGQYRGFDYTGSIDSDIASIESNTSDHDSLPVFNLWTLNRDVFVKGISILKFGRIWQSYENYFWGTFYPLRKDPLASPITVAPYKDCGGRDYFKSEQITPFKNYFSLKFHPNTFYPNEEVGASYFYRDYLLKDGHSANIGIQQYMGLDLDGNMCLYRKYERLVDMFELFKDWQFIQSLPTKFEPDPANPGKTIGKDYKWHILVQDPDDKTKRFWRLMTEDDITALRNEQVKYTYFGWNLNLLSLGLFDEVGLYTYPTDFDEMEYLISGDFDLWYEFLKSVNNSPNTPHYKKLQLLSSIDTGLKAEVMEAMRLPPEDAIARIAILIAGAGAGRIDSLFEIGDDAKNKLSKVFQAIQTFAGQFWGKKFAVKIPQIKTKIEPETLEIISSHIPVGQGYIDESEYLEAVLRNMAPLCGNFKSDNKIYAFLRFDELEGFTDLGSSTKEICSNRLKIDNPFSVFYNGLYDKPELEPCGHFLKATVDENLVFIDAKTGSSPRVIMSIPHAAYIGKHSTFHPVVLSIWKKYITHHNMFIGSFDDYLFDYNWFLISNEKGLKAGLIAPDGISDELVGRAWTWIVKEIGAGLTREQVKNRLIESFRLFLQMNDAIIKGANFGTYTTGQQFDTKIDGKRFLWPAFAGVPLLSNIERYGPWYNVKAYGGTDYEKDDDLVPWRYGSYNALNNVARAKIDFACSSQQESENGTLEFPGAPRHSIGDILINGGPYINGISVAFNNGGVKTTYRLQTWSPQYGNFAKSEVDRMNRLSSNLNKLDRLISNLYTEFSKGDKDILRLLNLQKRRAALDGPKNKKTSSPVGFIGAGSNTAGYLFDTNTSTETKLYQNYYHPYNLNETNYETYGYMSLDGIFRPFSTEMGAINASGIPHFEFPLISGIANRSVYELNPFPSGNVHDINFIARGNKFHDNLYEEVVGDVYTNVLKGVGLRAPLVLVGWGFDTNGNPVPNSGVENDGVANKEFMYNHYKRADKWKAGPLDVAWDDNRKVWTAVGGGGGVFLGQLKQSLSYRDTANADLIYPSGNTTPMKFTFGQTVVAADWLLPSGGFIPYGTNVILAKVNDYYFVVGQACGPEYFNTTVY